MLQSFRGYSEFIFLIRKLMWTSFDCRILSYPAHCGLSCGDTTASDQHAMVWTVTLMVVPCYRLAITGHMKIVGLTNQKIQQVNLCEPLAWWQYKQVTGCEWYGIKKQKDPKYSGKCDRGLMGQARDPGYYHKMWRAQLIILLPLAVGWCCYHTDTLCLQHHHIYHDQHRAPCSLCKHASLDFFEHILHLSVEESTRRCVL